MIARGVLILAILATVVTCFKTCKDVPFCSRFRLDQGTGLFEAQISEYKQVGDVLKVPLRNSKGIQLELQLSFLKSGTLRLKVLEPNSTRYQLKDVLVQEPVTVKSDVTNITASSIKLSPRGAYDSDVVITKGAPCLLDFHYKGKSYIVFDSSRLLMENDPNSKAFSFNVEFKGSTKLYGLHDHADSLTLRETVETKIDPYRLYNLDFAGYPANYTGALYGSVPVVYGHSPEKTCGVFLHNAAQQWVDITYAKKLNASAHFMVESGTLDLFVFFGPKFKDVVRQYVELTGKMHMPQLWTLGYQQSRFCYMTQEDAKDVVAKMESNKFPMDVIWLDLNSTDGFRYFTWNPTNYSDPVGMQKFIASYNKKVITVVDPHFKVDEKYPVYTGAKGKYFVKLPNGDDFKGVSWPGVASYMDFLNPEARKYFADWYRYDRWNYTTETLAGVWNDMNEPSTFNDQWENTIPPDTVHYGGVPNRDIHNMYGFLEVMATHDGLMKRDNGTRRPFILSRSHFAGSQRYAAIWTGDNTAHWPFIQLSYSECLLSNLVGLPFCGADVGGFMGDPDDEMLQRWYQAGAWLPFFRGHSFLSTKRREPYLLPPNVQVVVRNVLKNRYRHVPVFYTLIYQHVRSGDPVVSPLFYEYPDMVDIDDHILIGSDILAAPIMTAGAKTRTVHIPGENNTVWYRADLPADKWTVHKGGSPATFNVDISTSPYFYKAGSIVVLTDVERYSTQEMLKDNFTVHVNEDARGNAKGYFYLDDGVSFDYEQNGSFSLLELQFTQKGGLTVKKIDGKLDMPFVYTVVRHSIPKSGIEAAVNIETSQRKA